MSSNPLYYHHDDNKISPQVPPPQGSYNLHYGEYNQSPGSYAPPAQGGGYGNTGYAQPPPVNSAPTGYGQPTAGYGQPTAGYGQPTAGYGQPTAGYGQPTAGYGQPAHYPDAEFTQAKTDVTDQLFGSTFSDKAIRRGFIRKVYLILFAQLLVTFAFICLFIFVKPLKIWVQNNLWFYLLAYGIFLVLYITLVCCPGVRRKSPGNWICLSIFTLAFSYMTATISSFHDTGIVLMAAGITAAVCLAISIFAIQTKIDFTMCSGLLFALVMVLMFFGFACLITYYTWGYSRIMNCVYGGIAALVFGLFLIYDTQQVMGGRKYEISPEEYIYGALQLYIDIVYIFIIILGFVGNK